MLNSAELEEIRNQLEISEIISSDSVGGGDINQSFLIKTDRGEFFVKKNLSEPFPGMFPAEAKGLDLMRASQSVRIPEVHECFDFEDHAYLVMEYIRSAPQTKNFWKDFAERLSSMHRVTQDRFGLDHNNYIGSLNQSNNEHSAWNEFFITERLEPMIKMGVDDKKIPRIDLPIFDALFSLLQDFFPEEEPALIHGDLWSGNFMADDKGEPCIYDPAVYFGHREMDIGMSKLFGGFDRTFYEYYQEAFPMESGWTERIDVANIYPLLVHVNLFGGSYYQSVLRVIRDYC